MGNEMGNNNTSGLIKEEDDTSEAEKKLLQDNCVADYIVKQSSPASKGKEASRLPCDDTSDEDQKETLKEEFDCEDLKGENTKEAAEGKAVKEKISGLASDNAMDERDSSCDRGKETSGEPETPAKIDTESVEAGRQSCENESPTSLKDRENDEKQKESSLGNNLLVTSFPPPEKEALSSEQEEDGIKYTASHVNGISDYSETPIEMTCNQNELDKTHSEPCVQGGNNGPERQGSEYTPKSSLVCLNDHLDSQLPNALGLNDTLDHNPSANKDCGHTYVSNKENETQEEKYNQKLDEFGGVGDGFEDASSGEEIHCTRDDSLALQGETFLLPNSLNSNQEASDTEEGKRSARENRIDLCEEPPNESKTEIGSDSKCEYRVMVELDEVNKEKSNIDGSSIFNINTNSELEEARSTENGFGVDGKSEEGQERVEDTKEELEASHGNKEKPVEERELEEERSLHLATTDETDSVVLQTSIVSSLQYSCDVKNENGNDLFSNKGNSSQENSSNLEEPTQELVAEEALENDGGKDVEQYIQTSPSEELATKSSALDQPVIEQEIVKRHSTESYPESLDIPSQIQRSPSFNLDLRIEAKQQESERTPLIIEDPLKVGGQAAEDKSATLERCCSKKSKGSFLGFFKEEEEDKLVSTKEKALMAAASTKDKVKRKPKSSFFSNCMCCAT